jgi:hypothetical protein
MQVALGELPGEAEPRGAAAFVGQRGVDDAQAQTARAVDQRREGELNRAAPGDGVLTAP